MSNRKDRTQALAARSRFHMGDLQVHPDRLCVVREGQDVPLEPRAMEVLVVLAEKAGEAMSSTQLQISVWKTNAFGDNAVSKTVSVLRKMLGDDTRAPRYIESLKGRGYRLAAPVAFPKGYRRLSKPTEIWKDGSPFVGLAAFDAAHAAVFAGRSQVTGDLLDAMRGQIDSGRQFILIAGPSGCGKTSLLRAGVLPLLTRPGGFGGLRALSVATCDLAAAQGSDAMLPLAGALSSWVLGVRPVFAQQSLESLKSQLTDKPSTIVPAITEAFRRHPERGLDAQPHAHLLLVIDHAEALVTTMHDSGARSAFERALYTLCDAPRTLVAMIVRGDYAPDLAQALPSLNQRKAGGGHLDILAPTRGEISEIIREPASQANLEYEVNGQRERLDDALRDAAIGQPDALPLLQHTLQLLYEHRTENGTLTWEAYHRIGGLEGAIAHRADEVYAALPIDAQKSLDAVLTKLVIVQPDSDAVTARRAALDTLSDATRTLIDAFVCGRLLIRTLHEGRPHFGVVHEALLRQWPSAVEWIQENRRLLMAKARLERAAKRWIEEGRSADHLLNPGRPLAEGIEASVRFPEGIARIERELLSASSRSVRIKLRVRNGAISALALFAIITGTMAIFAWHARNEAIAQRQETLGLIDYMLVKMTPEIRPLGKLELLGSMSGKALTALERRPIEEMSSHELVQYARVLGLIGESLLKNGKSGEAKTNLDAAFLAASRAARISPNSTDALNELSQVSYWLGDYHYRLNQYSKTLSYWGSYHKNSVELLRMEKENSIWKRELGYAENNLGTVNFDLGNYSEALAHFTKSARLKQQNLPDMEIDPALHMDYIDTLSWISKSKLSVGEIRIASEEYSQQIESMRSVISNNPKADAWNRSLANSLARSADLEWMMGNHGTARDLIEESLPILTMLSNKQQDNSDWMRDLAFAHMKKSDILRSLGNLREASSHIQNATSIIEKITKSDNGNIEWVRLRSLIQIRNAALSPSVSGLATRIESSIKILDDLHRTYPDDYSGLIALSEALIASGDHYWVSGEDEAAIRHWNRSLSLIAARAMNSNEPKLVSIFVDSNDRLGTNNASVEIKRKWLLDIGFHGAPLVERHEDHIP